MDQYSQLRDTVLNASQQQAPLINNDPALQKFNDINYQLPLSNAGLQAVTANQSTTLENQNIAKSNAQERANAKKNYQRKRAPDGGWNFYDGDGNPITAKDYADAFGKSTADVLSGSENPMDIGYQEDYQNLQDFVTALSTGDKAKVEAYYQTNGDALRNMSPQEVFQKFREAYPTVYGSTPTSNQQAPGSTFIPSRTAANDTYQAAGTSGTSSLAGG